MEEHVLHVSTNPYHVKVFEKQKEDQKNSKVSMRWEAKQKGLEQSVSKKLKLTRDQKKKR